MHVIHTNGAQTLNLCPGPTRELRWFDIVKVARELDENLCNTLRHVSHTCNGCDKKREQGPLGQESSKQNSIVATQRVPANNSLPQHGF